MSNKNRIKYEVKKVPLGKLISKEFIIRDALRPNMITSAGEAKAKSSPVDEESINSLAKSIEQIGLLQNMVVVPRDNGTYEIIAGNRRYRALKKLNTPNNTPIPVLVVSNTRIPRAALLEIALTENLQRKKLSATELTETLIGILTERIGKIAIPDYPESINQDMVVQGLWYLNLILDPYIPKSSIKVDDNFIKFTEILHTLLKEELDKLGISFLDFILKIFPVCADPDLEESVMKGEIDVNKATVLARIKHRNEITNKQENNEEVRKEKESPRSKVNPAKVLKEIARDIPDEEIDKLNEESKKKFVSTFTREDLEKSEKVKEEAEKLGISKEDLKPKDLLREKERGVKNENVSIEESSGEIIQQLLRNEEVSPDEVLTLASDVSVSQVLDKFNELSQERKSLLLSQIIEQLETKMEGDPLTNTLIDSARVKAIEEVFEFIKKMSLASENDFLSGEGRQLKSEEVGYPNQIILETLGRFQKAYGEALIEISKKAVDDKKDIRGEAVKNDVLTILSLLITKLSEKKGEVNV